MEIKKNNYQKKIKADAMITKTKGIALGVVTADCVPILLYDSKKKIVAAIHAGWKGAFKGIVKKVINLGVSSYGTIREIKRLKKNENYNQIDTIIIQYHPNDYGENISMNPQKTYSEKEFKNFFNLRMSLVSVGISPLTFFFKASKANSDHSISSDNGEKI